MPVETPEQARARRLAWGRTKLEEDAPEGWTPVVDIVDGMEAEALVASRAALEQVRDACRRCKGSGVYMNDYCSMCGDSTWDHECDDPVETECGEPQCKAIRSLLAALEGGT